jgi:ankyrin repeat protein
VLVAALIVPAAARAQQQEPSAQPSGPEQLFEAIGNTLRDVFKGVFGTQEAELPAPGATPGEQQPPPQAPAQPSAQQPAPQPVRAAPSASAPPPSLHGLIAKGEYDAALKMLDSGADLEAKEPGVGASPLHYAVMKGTLVVVNQLLARGADVNSRTKSGTTPLHTAALYNRYEVAEALLARGADVNAKSVSGATPLTIAQAANYQRIAKLLRERGGQ